MSLPEQSKQDGGDGEDIQGFDFLRKSAWTDLQLDVEGKKIHVSKSFLATISPVFRLMFESDFKEKNVDILTLPGKKYEDVLTFLQCLNPGVLQKVNYANIYGVFPLAHEYQVQRLLEECKQCLQKELSSEPISIFDNNCRNVHTTLTVIRYCEICILAENYNLENLLTTCVTLFSRINAKWYKKVPMFQKISKELRNRIFCSRLGTIEGQIRAISLDSVECPAELDTTSIPNFDFWDSCRSGAEVLPPNNSKQDSSAGEDIKEIEFLKTTQWTDIQLDVEGKTLHVSRSFLATISPVFRLMFESDFKERNVDVLPLPGKKYEDVLTFLQCANPWEFHTVNYADIHGVLPLAHEYQVQGLLEECKNCLLTELLSIPMNIFDSNYRQTSTSLKILRLCEICSLAEEYCLEDLLEICVEQFTNMNVKWYVNVPMFQKISTKLRNRIFSTRLHLVEKVVK